MWQRKVQRKEYREYESVIPVISTVVTLFELEQSLKHLWELAAPIVAAMQIECAVKYLMR